MEDDKVYKNRNFGRGLKEPNPKPNVMLCYFILIIDLGHHQM